MAAGSAVAVGTAGAATTTTVPYSKFVLPSSLKGSAPSTVKIGLTGGYALNFLPTEIAMGAGFFNQVAKRFNTTISFDVYSGGSTAEPAFLGGTDQFTVIGEGSSLPSVAAGKDQVAVVNAGIQLSIVFTAAQKYKATRGTNVSAFGPPGNTWCQISPVGTSNAAALLLAALNHFSISQLNLTTIGSVAAVLPTLQSGQCQLTSGDVNSAATGIIGGTAYAVDNTETPEATIPLAGAQEGIPMQTSNAFTKQYPQLTQAIIDADVQALLMVQANYQNANALYNYLPSAMQQGLALGSFAQGLQLFGDYYSNKWYNATFTTAIINDTIAFQQGVGGIPASTTLNPSLAWSNTYALRAYKDLRSPLSSGILTGPAKMPTTPGMPSAEAASAAGTLSGKPAPANSGPSPYNAIVRATATTTTGATTTSS
jgi:hypothetical protein